MKRRSPEPGDAVQTRKRQKSTTAAATSSSGQAVAASTDDAASDTHSSSLRKGKACSICRKLKVKCDAGENGKTSCSRCIRLNLKCLSEKRTWTSAEDQNDLSSYFVQQTPEQLQANLVRLERAVEDILSNLRMPSLEVYTETVIVEQQQAKSSAPVRARPTISTAAIQPKPEYGLVRGLAGAICSPSPVDNEDDHPSSSNPAGLLSEEKDVSPGPINSLIEATRFQGLTSQLRSVKLRRKGGMRRMEHDLISEKIITPEEAEKMLELFKDLLSPYLFSATIDHENSTLAGIRKSSTVLFTAIILVSALHMPGKEDLHEACHARFLGLVSSAIFDRFHTLDDIRGLCVAAFWQPDLSWKLSGIAIRMATELNLHHAFHEAFYTENLSVEMRAECLEKARIWYLLFVLDHQSSIAYGRPPVMAELRPIKDSDVLLRSEWCKPSDHALVAQVTGCAILSRAFEMFGLEPRRTMGGDDRSVLSHLKFLDDARAWSEKWRAVSPTPFTEDPLHRAVELHNYFSELVLNSLVLRGRSLDALTDLPPSLRPLALRATEAAHAILGHFTTNMHYAQGINGMPLYLLSMIAFAVVFLMKLAHRWHAIGISIDPAKTTKPLIENIIKLLRGCQVGANHMVHSMANGFERMLKQSESKVAKSAAEERARPRLRSGRQKTMVDNNSVEQIADHRADLTPGAAQWDFAAATANMVPTPGLDHQPGTNSGQSFSPMEYNYPVSTGSDLSFGNWGFQDEELWSIGMGYDLLAPSGQGMTNADFPLPMYGVDQSLWPT